MAKGLFTQGICVLLEQAVDPEQIESALSGFEIVGRHNSIGSADPTTTVVLRFRPDAAGHVLVSYSDQPWPDDMGDPEDSAELFVAWSLGQFGPLAFPGCLSRAREQSWGWEAGREAPQRHTAHIRLLTSYVIGQEEDQSEATSAEDVDEDAAEEARLLPEDYDPIEELQFLMKVVAPLMELPGAICYFNPGGEVLRDASALRQGLNHAWQHGFPPLDMWTNVRLYQATQSWSLMDTVGNGQFDLPDMEAVFVSDGYKAAEVEEFLRSASLYLLHNEDAFEDGDTADGPGDILWHALACEDALADPPRPTIRWIPDDEHDPPEELLEVGGDDEDVDDAAGGNGFDFITEEEIARIFGEEEPDSPPQPPDSPPQRPGSPPQRPEERPGTSAQRPDEDPEGPPRRI